MKSVELMRVGKMWSTKQIKEDSDGKGVLGVEV